MVDTMHRRRFTSLAVSSALAGLCASAKRVQAEPQAGPIKAVLELFTSQGCSSCPAADAMFERFTQRPDVVALTFPVDYWDYLGWKDTLASARFTERQRHYAKVRGDGQIYTPQLIVNGKAHTNGADAASIEKIMTKVARNGANNWIGVKVGVEGAHVIVDAGSAGQSKPEKADVTVWLATVAKRADVVVKRGENAGKTLAYFNVVRDISAVGMWTGDAVALRLDRAAAARNGADACAILLQSGMAGPIVGAAMLPRL